MSPRPRTRHSARPQVTRMPSGSAISVQMVFSVWHFRASRLLLSSRPLSLRVLYLPIPSGRTSPRITQSCTLVELTINFTTATSLMYLSPTRYGCAERSLDSELISTHCRATGRPISMLYMSTDSKLPVPPIRSSTVSLP